LCFGYAQPPDDPSQKLPTSLLRRYEVFIKPRNGMKPLKMRDIKATSIGHLVTLHVRAATTDDSCLRPRAARLAQQQIDCPARKGAAGL